MLSKHIKGIKKIVNPDKFIVDEIILTNMNRAFYLSIVSIPMRFLTIVNFLNKPPTGNEKEILWRTGIIKSHTVFLILMIILGGLSYLMRKKKQPNFVMAVVQYAMPIIILFFGAVLASIDQLVTYSITPFLIASLAVGVIFLIKPFYSLLIFLSGYIVFYFPMGIMQSDPSILSSNRVNGLTSIILGIFLSFILWRSNVIYIKQREYIERQQKELGDKNKELERLATHDFLTDLFNRRHFEERMILELLRLKRYGNEASLLILDIDDFSSVNNRYGHPVGDEVLKGFAHILKTQIRKTDIIARIGGEEFAIFLLNSKLEIGKMVAEKLRRCVEENTFIVDGQKIKITVSIGITILDSRTETYEEAYKYADKALYKAKSKGKNRVDIELKPKNN